MSYRVQMAPSLLPGPIFTTDDYLSSRPRLNAISRTIQVVRHHVDLAHQLVGERENASIDYLPRRQR